MLRKTVSGIMLTLLLIGMFVIFPIDLVKATSTVHFICSTMNRGNGGSITFAGTTYQHGQSASYSESDYWITGNPPSPTTDWFFYQWRVLYIGSQSWVDNQYAQSTWFHLRGEAYLEADFYSPIHANNPTSPITWGTKQRITGTANQYSGQQLTVSYYPQGSGMGPPNRNGVPPFGGSGYYWTTVTVSSGSWDTGLIYPTLPISLGQQLPQTYDVYALWAGGAVNEVDSNVVSFTLNPASAQIAAPALTPSSIELGQSVTITDQIFSSAYVNAGDLSGTLTVQAKKQGAGSWIDVASQTFTSIYGYSSVYGQTGVFYDLSITWTPTETGTYDVRVVYSGNKLYLPIPNPPSAVLTVGEPTYSVAFYAHCNTEGTDVNVEVRKDSEPTGPNTPCTFTGLTGTHTFTVPNADSNGHPFKQWNTGETSSTISVSSSGTYTAYYQETYEFTVKAHCNTEGMDVSVSVVLDDSPPGYPTPYTFTSTIATHKFTVPSSDSSGHSFREWSTGETTTSINVNSGGTYTAYYGSAQRKLTVSSAHDNPNPPNGDNFYGDGQSVTCSVTSPVTEGGTIWTCTGWTGTGSVPASGSGITVTFTMTQDSSITWNWQGHANHPPSIPSTPVGQVICQLYKNGIYQGPWTYSASASDSDGDMVKLTFSWDDGSSDVESAYTNPGQIVCVDHTWTELSPDGYQTGMHKVRVKATDEHGAESGWSTSLEVTVIGDKIEDIWAGYVQKLTIGTVASVEGQWVVPTFTPISFGNDGTWVGVGGVSGRLLQAGIKVSHAFYVQSFTPFIMVVNAGKKEYHKEPWMDLDFSKSVNSGDSIYVSIILQGSNQWQVSIQDVTKGWTWTKIVTCEPDLSTAEWIHEPGANSGGSIPLPWSPFTPIDFSLARCKINGVIYEVGKVPPNLKTVLFTWNFKRDGAIHTSVSSLREYERLVISCLTAQNLPKTPITGISLHSSADLGIYDMMGNHLGYNVTTGGIDWGIQNALYWEDEAGAQYAILFDPSEYHIELIGSNDGEYHLHTQAVFNDTVVLDQWTNETITANETKEYLLIHQISFENLENLKTIIGEGYNSSIIVMIANKGNYTETFNVTAYANATVIGTQLVTLTSANSTIITFTWNTTGFAKGNYTISAYAWPVPGETHTADNTLVDDWVIVSMVGDITGPDGWPDGKCDMRDIRMVAKLFGVSYPDPRYNPNCDVNDDGKIDMKDVRTVAKNFGKIDP